MLGSGGCTSIPRATCSFRVYKEAREKGTPYSSFDCSLFLEDINLLIDTPEDINMSLNKFDIKSIDNVLYSHWHPYHTLGMRVFEQIKNKCLEKLLFEKSLALEINVINIRQPLKINPSQ